MGRDLFQDIRFGVRALARRPGFALTAVLVLGLGIGAATTVFTLVDRIFFWRPPEIAEPHRLVRVWRAWAPGQGGGSLGHPDYQYYRERATTVTGLAAWGGSTEAVISEDGTSGGDQVRLGFVSDNWLAVLGVTPALGRSFLPEEGATPGTHPVAVLGHGTWTASFAADPGVIGRTVRINGQPVTVVGVMPERFRGVTPLDRPYDLVLPIAMYGAFSGAPDDAWWRRLPGLRSNWLSVVARLAPGVTFEAARAELDALSSALVYEGREEGEGVMVSRQYLYSPGTAATLSRLSKMLAVVVGIVLVVALANVAVLLLSRGAGRRSELAVRTAIGAGRGRLVRQLVAESLVLGALGGLVGVALAWLSADLSASLLPFPFAIDFAPDGRVLAAATGLTLVTALLAGLLPALHTTRDLRASMHAGASPGGTGALQGALVMGQVGLSLVLVGGAVLFGRSFWTARGEDVGFATGNRLVVEVDLRSHGYDEERGKAFIRDALERVAALPGVLGVTTSQQIAFQGEWSTDFEPSAELFPEAAPGTIRIGLNTVGPGYFELMELPLLSGRAPDAGDLEGATPVVVVNETLAGRLWPGGDAIGRQIPLVADVAFTVIGVARDATYYELGEAPWAQAYGSVFQVYRPNVNLVVRTAGPPAEMAHVVQAAVREIDPALAFAWVTTLDSVFEEVVARYRVSAVLVGLASALALALAAAGLYAVISFLVARRTREIGVRMALGASRGRVAGEVARAALKLAAGGVVLGVAGVLLLRRFTAALLYGVQPADPWTLPGACLALLVVTVVASLAPAKRATRVDPLLAMRAE